jgi:hypothetical protein
MLALIEPRHPLRRLTAVALLWMVAAMASACTEGSTGAEGFLVFYDQTRDLNDFLNLDQELDRAIAQGATLNVAVRDSDRRPADISEAESSDESVLAVSSVQTNEILVEAIAPGSAELQVSASGVSDRIALSVAAIASSELVVLPWGESTLLPESVYEGGVAMTPGTNTSLFLQHRNAGGDELTGYGARTLSTSEGSTLTPTASSDFYTLRAPDETGTIELTTEGIDESIEVVELSAITSLTLDDLGQNGREMSSSFQVTTGSYTYAVGAYTDDGRYVIAPFDETFELAIEADSTELMSMVELSDDGNQLLADGRAIFLSYDQPGTAQFTLRWLDFELPFTVEIVPDTNGDGVDGDGDGDGGSVEVRDS